MTKRAQKAKKQRRRAQRKANGWTPGVGPRLAEQARFVARYPGMLVEGTFSGDIVRYDDIRFGVPSDEEIEHAVKKLLVVESSAVAMAVAGRMRSTERNIQTLPRIDSESSFDTWAEGWKGAQEFLSEEAEARRIRNRAEVQVQISTEYEDLKRRGFKPP